MTSMIKIMIKLEKYLVIEQAKFLYLKGNINHDQHYPSELIKKLLFY